MIKKKTSFIYLLSQILTINLAFGLSNMIIFDTFWVDGWAYPSLWIVVNLSFVFAFIITRHYDIKPTMNFFQVVHDSIELFLFILFIVLIYRISVDAPKYYKVSLFLFIFFGFIIKIFVDRLFIEYLRRSASADYTENATVIGSGEFKDEIVEELKSHSFLGIKYVEFSQNDIDLHYLKNFITSDHIKHIYIDIDNFQIGKIEAQLRKIAENNLVKFYVISDILGGKLKRNTYELVGKIPVVPLFTYPLDNPWYRLLKRIFDILFSLFVIVFVLSWLFPIIALIIKLQSPGPILYIHDRIGLNNIPFKCLKFRTMNVRDKDEPFQQTVKGDKRIFPLGKFLRKTNIDEFPQFFNSLVGDISIVGPRPMMLGHMLEFDQEIEEMYSRHLVKPGITGLAQVTGYRGEIDGVNKMRGRIRMDRYYLHNWSFILDIKIIWWTVRNSIRGDKDAI